MYIPQVIDKNNSKILRNSNQSAEQEEKILEEIKTKQNNNDFMTPLMVRKSSQKVIYRIHWD